MEKPVNAPPILSAIDGDGVAWLTLSRPVAHNAMNGDLIARMTETLRRLDQDPRSWRS